MGAAGTGIRTIEDLKDRCWIDDETGCWHYKGGAKASGAPSIWIPAIDSASTLSQALCVLTKGRRLKDGEHFRPTCKTKYCANPEHNKSGTLSAMRMSQNIKRTPIYKAKMMDTLRKKSIISDEQIAELMVSNEASKDAAMRLGISQSYVNKLRRGSRRKPYMAAPGASVFNWRP